jgi:hypothetical protein
MTGEMSLSDIAAVTRDNNGWGDGMGGWWMIILFALIFGNGMWGGNGNQNQGFTQAEVQRGFDNSAVIGKLDRLGDGLSSGFYAQNTNLLEGFNGIQRDMCTGFSAVNAAINAAAAQSASCCCETNRNIDAVRYENAINTASINSNIDTKFAALEKSQLEQTIAAQQNQISQLYLNSQLCGVVRYPMSTAYGAGTNPFFNSGCGYCGGNV